MYCSNPLCWGRTLRSAACYALREHSPRRWLRRRNPKGSTERHEVLAKTVQAGIERVVTSVRVERRKYGE